MLDHLQLIAWAEVDYGTSPYQLISVRGDHDQPRVINWQDTNVLCICGSSQIYVWWKLYVWLPSLGNLKYT